MKGTMLVEGDLVKVSDGPVTIPIIPPPGGGVPDPQAPPLPPPPPDTPARIPYFDIGDAEGKPGETVEIFVQAGCAHPMNGFHIGGGVGFLPNVERSGYGKFKAIGTKLGPFLRGYLKAQDVLHDEPFHQHEHFWSDFQFVTWEGDGALPEEFWEFAVGFFSLDQVRMVPPIPIPAGTDLFSLEIEILDGTPEGQYVLTCADEHYYTNSRARRRDYTWTYSPQGFTKIETFPGLLRVTA